MNMEYQQPDNAYAYMAKVILTWTIVKMAILEKQQFS